MTKRRFLTALLVAVVMAQPAAAGGVRAEEQATTGPAAEYYGYLTPEITISKGDSIVYSNFDVVLHDFVQDVEADGHGGKTNAPWCEDEGEHGDEHHHGCPVFWSEQIGFQEETRVKGLGRVKPGKTYTFFCTLHHGMKGTLTVRP